MALKLTTLDRAMLAGEEGPAPRMAMSILVRMAEIQTAPGMLDITAAHIDSTLYMGEATLAFAERLASMDAQVRVPTTLNVSGVDEVGWQDWAVPEGWAHNAQRQMQAYASMGCIPTWTCAPYQAEQRPRFGQQIAWGESNAIAFANSVIGARTERYPDLLDICAAITGRVPAVGLHLPWNRAGQVVYNLVDIPREVQQHESFYPVLGHLLGRLAGDRIPVVDGMTAQPAEDQLKSLCAAAASSGAVALLHLVGITPEAPSLQAALQGKPPLETGEVTRATLAAAWDELSTAKGKELDLVVLGSPHFSLQEFEQLARLVEDKRRHPGVRFLITSSRAMTALADQAGYLEPIRSFGAEVTLDTCILTTPMLPEAIKVLMTNSAKYAYYSPGLLGKSVAFGSTEDCVRSAVEGRVVQEDHPWRT